MEKKSVPARYTGAQRCLPSAPGSPVSMTTQRSPSSAVQRPVTVPDVSPLDHRLTSRPSAYQALLARVPAVSCTSALSHTFEKLCSMASVDRRTAPAGCAVASGANSKTTSTHSPVLRALPFPATMFSPPILTLQPILRQFRHGPDFFFQWLGSRLHDRPGHEHNAPDAQRFKAAKVVLAKRFGSDHIGICRATG